MTAVPCLASGAGPAVREDLVDHSTFIFLMGPDGRFIEIMRPQLTIDEMAKRLRARVGDT